VEIDLNKVMLRVKARNYLEGGQGLEQLVPNQPGVQRHSPDTSSHRAPFWQLQISAQSTP